MRPSARVRANRANAKKSTGPRTKEGKSTASRNAFKYGLSVSSSSRVRPDDVVQKIAQSIAGEDASAQRLRAAMDIAEADFDILRVRRVRLDLMSDPKAREKWVSPRELSEIRREMSVKMKRVDVNERTGKFSPEQIEYQRDDVAYYVECALTPKPQTLERGMGLLAATLSRIDRYERSALARRRQAIEQFDELVAEEDRASLAADAQ